MSAPFKTGYLKGKQHNNEVGASVVHSMLFNTMPDYGAIMTDLTGKLNSGQLWVIDIDDNYMIKKSKRRTKLHPL